MALRWPVMAVPFLMGRDGPVQALLWPKSRDWPRAGPLPCSLLPTPLQTRRLPLCGYRSHFHLCVQVAQMDRGGQW